MVVVVVLCSCGRSELIDGRETDLASFGLRDAGQGKPRTCSAIDAGPPQLDTLSTFPEGCLDVMYTDQVDLREVAMLDTALARWSMPDCTRVCFKPTRPWNSVPNQAQLLLFDLDDGLIKPTDGPIVVFYGNLPGRGRREHAVLSRKRNSTATVEDFTRAVGEVLGFTQTPGVVSSLNENRVDLTEADHQSLCSVYPCR
jgi:hypothetical protein